MTGHEGVTMDRVIAAIDALGPWTPTRWMAPVPASMD